MLRQFKREETMIFTVLAVIAAFSFLLDNAVFSFFLSIKGIFLDSFMSFINNPVTLSAIFAIVFIYFSVHQNHKTVKRFIITILSSFIIATLLKSIIARPRPFGLEKMIPLLNLNDFSFPSGHAFMAFAMLPMIADRYPKYKVWFFVLAILIALTRVYNRLHYFSDIAFGSALGYLLGLFMLRKWEKFK
jgi:undecaprenyl-diphosphatase